MIKSVNTHDEFVDAMNILEMYSRKVTLLGGFDKFTPEEDNEYDTLAHLVSDYEDSIPVFPPDPNMTYEKLILIYMMHKRYKMAETANRLGIFESELLEILAGKRHIDYQMSQKLYDVLGVKSDYLLQAA